MNRDDRLLDPCNMGAQIGDKAAEFLGTAYPTGRQCSPSALRPLSPLPALVTETAVRPRSRHGGEFNILRIPAGVLDSVRVWPSTSFLLILS